MKVSDVIKLFAVISAAYPRDTAFANADKQMVGVWADMLCDISADTAGAAVRAHVSTSPFPPSITEIRTWAAKLTAVQLDTDQAWGLVTAAIHKYGYWQAKEAQENLPPEVWEMVIRVWITWQDLCASENIIAERAHFFRLWEARTKRENGALPAELRLGAGASKAELLAAGNEARRSDL